MPAPIKYHRHFLGQIKKLPREVQVRVLARVVEYAESGRGDVRPVLGGLKRLREGDYRVFFGETGGELRVVGVFHRKFRYARHILLASLDRLKRFRE